MISSETNNFISNSEILTLFTIYHSVRYKFKYICDRIYSKGSTFTKLHKTIIIGIYLINFQLKHLMMVRASFTCEVLLAKENKTKNKTSLLIDVTQFLYVQQNI